jgi:hypothetical protein
MPRSHQVPPGLANRGCDGELVQVDRGGNPTINPFVNPHDDLLTEFPYLGPPNFYPV